MNVGILGGGITGITLQRYLEHPSEVLEAADRIGGLCKTFHKDGFGYDVGGHILFSKSQDVNAAVDELLGENIGRRRRANKVYFKDRFVKYPFENGLGVLDKQDNYDCLIGYLQRDYPPPKNLKEWCYHRFGKGIAEKYLIPYNEKIWNIPADQMSLEWVDRIPSPPTEDVVRSSLGIETEGYLHQLHFRYPRHGGIESLVTAARKPGGAVTCQFPVEKIRKGGDGKWAVSGPGGDRRFDRLTVAFPIHDAIKCFDDVPAEVRAAVDGLRYNTINVVMVAVNDESLMDVSAVYIPDPDVVTHRICYMGYFSPHLVRPGTSSLIAEVTTNPGDGVHELTDAELTERVVADLHRKGLLDRSKVIVTDVTRMKYGYPVYDLDYARNIKVVRDHFAAIGVELCGRFAEFEYINSDECMRRAMALAARYNAER